VIRWGQAESVPPSRSKALLTASRKVLDSQLPGAGSLLLWRGGPVLGQDRSACSTADRGGKAWRATTPCSIRDSKPTGGNLARGEGCARPMILSKISRFRTSYLASAEFRGDSARLAGKDPVGRIADQIYVGRRDNRRPCFRFAEQLLQLKAGDCQALSVASTLPTVSAEPVQQRCRASAVHMFGAGNMGGGVNARASVQEVARRYGSAASATRRFISFYGRPSAIVIRGGSRRRLVLADAGGAFETCAFPQGPFLLKWVSPFKGLSLGATLRSC